MTGINSESMKDKVHMLSLFGRIHNLTVCVYLKAQNAGALTEKLRMFYLQILWSVLLTIKKTLNQKDSFILTRM